MIVRAFNMAMASREESGTLKASPASVCHAAPVSKRPTLPSSFFKFPIRSRFKVIQQYISSFEYKQSPQTSFNSHKSRPLSRIMDTAKMMIYNPQPIKCVEAVFLALFLTAGIPNAERIPLGFKSELHGQVHQHIVLLVKHNGKYGAFGISRQHNLMSKEFEFESISSIVDDFRKAYEDYEHKVIRIRVGLPVEHNIESFNFVCWRYLSLDPSLASWEQCSEALERHMNHGKRLWERWLWDGQGESKRADLFLKNELDMKPTLEAHQSSLNRKISKCSVAGPAVKAVKRRQEADKQDPDYELAKRRVALREMRSLGNIADSQPLACKTATTFPSAVKALPPLPWREPPRNRPKSTRRCSQGHINMRNAAALIARPIPITQQKDMKKIAVKGYSMELFSGSRRRLGLQTDGRKPTTKQELKRAQGSGGNSQLPNNSSRKRSSKFCGNKADATVTGPAKSVGRTRDVLKS